MILTSPILALCMPNAGERVPIFVEALNHAMLEFGIDSPLRVAFFLSQIAHESGSLRYVAEIADGRDYEGRTDLGNSQPGDGPRFKGRGGLMITGRTNYEACSRGINHDLLADSRYAETPMGFARTAAWFWKSKGLNTHADAGNFWTVSKLINGGTNGLDDRIQHYIRCRRALGI
jgi:putative chitinase